MIFGIITFHNIPNIGAILQAYSLCKFFRMKGHECYLIDYTCENIKKRELTFRKKANPVKNVLLYGLFLLREKRKIENCQRFMRDAGVYSVKRYYCCNQELADDFDVLISGSDMIWNLNVTGYDWTYFGEGLPKNKLRYSYASSVGDKWDEKDIANVKRNLSEYRLLSAREEDTVAFIKNELHLECKCMPDPTMLLTPCEWEFLVEKVDIEQYVLVYFPSNGLLDAASEYAKHYGYKVVVINNGLPIRDKGVLNRAIYNPREWISLVKNAKAVFTNSYHGFLFALYFHRKVWTESEGNRFLSIIKKLDLSCCMIKNDRYMESSIDYKKVDKKLAEMRKEGGAFIEDIIDDANCNLGMR